MQAYGPGFAHAYNWRWGAFARWAAPQIAAFYAQTIAGQQRRPVLDLCCGSGQGAPAFLERGYAVTGLDLSPHMLAHARENLAPYLAVGRAALVLADAADFALEQRFGLAVSLYDALNHLPHPASLQSCFGCVAAALAPGGWLVFDLNTRLGLRHWNVTSMDDAGESVVITHSSFDGTGAQAVLDITGFLRSADGRYERFDERVYNTVFEIAAVLAGLRAAGFASAHAARLDDLSAPLDEPEREARVFIVAHL